MLYGSPCRREHRPSGGALALFVRGYGSTGQHRPPARPRRRPTREPQQTAQLLSRGLAGLILLGLVATGVFFVVASEQRRAAAPAEAEAEPDPIAAGMLASRTVDAAPLTVEEVFPDGEVVRPASAAPYRITMTHIDTDCGRATTGELGLLLAAHGCSQVVRAGLVAPYGDYQVTAGLFNLADAPGAADVDGRLRQLVETSDGSFATLPTGHTDPDALPTAQVGWRTRGHYLLYCVITRPHGELVAAGDPVAVRITSDLVDGYLGTTILSRRSASF